MISLVSSCFSSIFSLSLQGFFFHFVSFLLHIFTKMLIYNAQCINSISLKWKMHWKSWKKWKNQQSATVNHEYEQDTTCSVILRLWLTVVNRGESIRIIEIILLLHPKSKWQSTCHWLAVRFCFPLGICAWKRNIFQRTFHQSLQSKLPSSFLKLVMHRKMTCSWRLPNVLGRPAPLPFCCSWKVFLLFFPV